MKEQNASHEPDGGAKIRKNMHQMMQIDRKVDSLNGQREQLYRETCKIVCEMPDSEMKYLWGAGTDVLCIYLEHSGFQATIYVGYIIGDTPEEDQMSKCPGGRREEFLSIWKRAKAEMDQRRSAHDDSGGFERDSTGRTDDERQGGSFGADSRSQKAVRSIRLISPEFRKKAGKVIARYFHEDNGHSTEESQWANAIYEFLTAV